MGVPTEPFENSDTAQDVKTDHDNSPTKETTNNAEETKFVEDNDPPTNETTNNAGETKFVEGTDPSPMKENTENIEETFLVGNTDDSPTKEEKKETNFVEKTNTDNVEETVKDDDGGGGEGVVETGVKFDCKEGKLDENANVEFKLERLQLNGILEEEDEGQGETKDLASNGTKTSINRKNENDVTSAQNHTMANGEGYNEELLTPQYGEGEEKGEGEDEEEEEGPQEMTLDERKEMHEAAKEGDIELLEDLLEKPNADITMTYFKENLLVTALKANQVDTAEFLLDNGVDHNYAATYMHYGSLSTTGKASSKKPFELYHYTCRQMAYDKGFFDLVELIDILNDQLFPGIKPRERIPRYRRTPPTPSASSTTLSDTSSSSGDESDISAEVKSSLGIGEEPRLVTSSSRRTSTSKTSDDNFLTVPTRTKKKKKGRGNSIEAGKEGREKEEEKSPTGKDSEMNEERKKRSKRKTPEEKDWGSSIGDEEGSVSRRSGYSQMDGDITDRSRATSKTSRQTGEGEEGEGEGGGRGGNDEGYETMSPSPSHLAAGRQQQQGPRFQPPNIPVKPNKAFLALRRSIDTHKQHCVPTKYNEARPLHWKKVKSAGSYETESPLWHQPSSSSPKLPPPTPAGTATTVSMLSPRSGVQARSEIPAQMVSTIEISAGNVTKPKIMQPSHRLGSGLSSGTAVSSSSSVGSATPSITSTYTPTNDRLYPLKLKVPSYMRMTTSCFVKRRLEPNFTNTYGSLDFVEPSPAAFHGPVSNVRVAGDSLVHGGRVNSDGVSRNSLNAALSGRTVCAGLPSVPDASTVSPTLSRKKSYGVSGVVGGDCLHRRVDMVPNIRNNSSVIHTPKLTCTPAKFR